MRRPCFFCRRLRLRAIAKMSGNSIVPSIAEWLDRICSIRVEPARGRLTMKMGSGALQPACPARAWKEFRCEAPPSIAAGGARSSHPRRKRWHPAAQAHCLWHSARTRFRTHRHPQALFPARNGDDSRSSLSEISRAPIARASHRHLAGVEPERLQVRETPIGFTQARQKFDASAIRRDAIILRVRPSSRRAHSSSRLSASSDEGRSRIS